MTEEVKTENTETQTAEQIEVKTFTQEEVNAIVQDRLDKEKRKLPSKDELKAFSEWKESQKTNEEKALEKDKRIMELENTIKGYENLNKVISANVDPKFQKFVSSEVSSMGEDFDANLKSYLESNSQYLIQKQEIPKTTGISQNTSNTVVSEEKAYLDKKYANNPYYKK